MATIYRVEHAETKTGPFWGETERISHAIMTYYNANGHSKGEWPIPSQDGFCDSLDWPYCMIFGCISIELLMYWFPHHFHEGLDMAGFVIAVYEADDVTYGGHQCAFDQYEAKRVTQFCFNELDNLMAMAA